jgi:hypothetical protein
LYLEVGVTDRCPPSVTTSLVYSKVRIEEKSGEKRQDNAKGALI